MWAKWTLAHSTSMCCCTISGCFVEEWRLRLLHCWWHQLSKPMQKPLVSLLRMYSARFWSRWCCIAWSRSPWKKCGVTQHFFHGLLRGDNNWSGHSGKWEIKWRWHAMGTFQPAVQRHLSISDQTRSVSLAQPTEQKWLISAHNATDQMQKKVRTQQKEEQMWQKEQYPGKAQWPCFHNANASYFPRVPKAAGKGGGRGRRSWLLGNTQDALTISNSTETFLARWSLTAENIN